MIRHKYQGECCTSPPCYRSLIPTSYFSNMKGGLIEINSGVSSPMMEQRLPPSRSRWSAVCQASQQREELIKPGWVVSEEGRGSRPDLWVFRWRSRLVRRSPSSGPAGGLPDAGTAPQRELAAQLHLCGLVFCLRVRSHCARLRLPAVVLKSAHSGGGDWRAAGRGAELILNQTSAWRNVNKTRTLGRVHTHTNTNPHFIKRDECPRGIQLSSMNLNMLSCCTLKEGKLILNIWVRVWNVMQLLVIIRCSVLCLLYCCGSRHTQ